MAQNNFEKFGFHIFFRLLNKLDKESILELTLNFINSFKFIESVDWCDFRRIKTNK